MTETERITPRDFCRLYEAVDGIFSLILRDAKDVEETYHIETIIIHKWLRSDPPCIGSWARNKVRNLKERMAEASKELQQEVKC